MKYFFIFLISIISIDTAISQTNFTNVISHNKVCIVTNPKKGTNSFKNWAVFPAENKEIRRITMNVTLAYPEDMAIVFKIEIF